MSRVSLEHAILVSLAEQPASGYDLARRFDRSLGFFWSASHQQIYRTLARMETSGLASAQVRPGAGAPDRKEFSLTEAGRAELQAWTREPSPPERLRSAFAVKVRGMRHGDPDAVVRDIRRQREEHAAQLAYYERNAAKNFPDPEALHPEEVPIYLVLRGGIRTEQALLDWCDEMLNSLEPEENS